MARRLSIGRQRAGSVRRRLVPHRRALRFEPLEARLCLSAAQLVGHWSFDNVLDDTIVDSASDFDGMKKNGGPTTGIAGVVGEAADFAGGANNTNSHFVDLGEHAGTFGGLATGTVSAWVKPERLPGTGQPTDVLTIFSVSNANVGTGEMRFFVNNAGGTIDDVPVAGRLSYGVRGGTGTATGHLHSESNTLFDGAWHHVAVTVGAGHEARIYIDGNLEAEGVRSFMTGLNANASAIGRNKDNTSGGGQWFFGGQMDDVGLWNDALTSAEVKALVSLAQHVQLNYDLGQAERLFNLADAGSGSVIIEGQPWHGVSGLAADPLGEIVQHVDGTLSMHLGDGNGVRTPQPILVTNAASTGPGSLRAAIELANMQPEADLVRFDASLSGQTISLGGAELVISDALSIDSVGLFENPIIDAQHNSRIFNINGPGNNFDVTIAGLTLTRGQMTGDNSSFSDQTFSGGAIRSLTTGHLTIDKTSITDSHVAGNNTYGGGIFTRGDVTLTDSTVSGSSAGFIGGGISAGNVTLIQSTVSGNSAIRLGGGIGADSAMLTNSIVNGNSAEFDGGGIFARITTLANSTVSGNFAGDGGGGIIGTTVTLNQSTVSGNTAGTSGGGIRSSNVTLTGSIVAGNAANVDNPDLRTSVTGMLSVNYSLIGDTAGLTPSKLAAINAGAGNLVDVDPLLGPLADNGGPTMTHALLPGSPAIDAGDPNITSPPNFANFDQRGAPYPRVTDGDGDFVARIDIGAVESLGLQNPSFEHDGGSRDAWTGFNNTGVDGSIALHGSHSIHVAADPAGFSGIYQSVPIQGGELLVASAHARLDGPISAGNFGELKLEFYSVFGGGFGDLLGQQIVVTAVDTIATNNWRQTTLVATAPAGAVEARLVATFVGSTPGEAIFYDALSLREAFVVDTLTDESNGDYSSGNLSLREAIEIANASGGADLIVFDPSLGGGTIELAMGHMTIAGAVTIDAIGLAAPVRVDAQEQSRIFDITGPGNNFDVTIAGLTLTRGQTTGDNGIGETTFDGGAIRSLSRGELRIDQTSITDSHVTGDRTFGGGIASRGAVTLTDSTVSGNSAGSGGGGIAANNVTLIRSIVSGNTADGAFGGGGIHASSVTLTQSTVSGNSAQSNGGGIVAYFNLSLNQSTVSGNSAGGSGGGIHAVYFEATLSQSTVSGNSAGVAGGGIFSRTSDVTLTDSTVSGNSTGNLAQSKGGGIDAQSGHVTLAQSTISGNYAVHGGGIYARYATLSHSTVSGNSALGAGGGMYVKSRPTLTGSIVAGNTAHSSDNGPDLIRGVGTITVEYSLIGDRSGASSILNVDDTSLIGTSDEPIVPHLGPLADNGGPTFTHALLPDSPALDAGNPAAVAGMGGVPEFDQRGIPFTRVHGGRIDIGAFELQPAGPALPGDFNGNGAVENADLTLLLNNWGSLVPPAPAGWVGTPLTAPAVDNDELTALLNNWGQISGSGAVSDAALVQPPALIQTLALVPPGVREVALAAADADGTQDDHSSMPPSFIVAGDLPDLRSSRYTAAPFRATSRVGLVRVESPSPQAVDLLLAVASDTRPTMDVDGASLLHPGDDPEAAGNDPSFPAMDEALAELASDV